MIVTDFLVKHQNSLLIPVEKIDANLSKGRERDDSV